eukprot:577310-Pelagomonas_calceolata.AAC.1
MNDSQQEPDSKDMRLGKENGPHVMRRWLYVLIRLECHIGHLRFRRVPTRTTSIIRRGGRAV